MPLFNTDLIVNALPMQLKVLAPVKFKSRLREWLLDRPFYSMDDIPESDLIINIVCSSSTNMD